MDPQVRFLKALSQNLWSEFESQTSHILDFSFRFPDGTVLRAHRNVLAASSEFFKNKFSIGMADSTSPECLINSFSVELFKLFLEFLYTGQISTFPRVLFSGLFELAQFYDIPLLTAWLIEFGIYPENLPLATSAAVQFLSDGLLDKCKSVAQNLLPVIPEESLQNISEEVAGILLWAARNNGLLAVECFKFFSKWCKANNTESTMLALTIDPTGMTKHDVENLVIPSGLIPRHILSEFKHKSIPPQDFSKLKSSPRFSFKQEFSEAFGITISPTQNRVAVTDYELEAFYLFDCSGNLIFAVGAGADSDSEADCRENDLVFKPTGAAFSLEGLIYLADSTDHGVDVFDSEGRFLYSISHEMLENPNGICIDHTKQEIHVCSQDKNTVCVFSEHGGKFLFSYGEKGSGPGQLHEPTGVAMDVGQQQVYVADKYNARVNVFTTSGEFVTSFGHAGGDPKGEFSVGDGSSKRIAVDPASGHIFVTDRGLNTLQVFNKDREWVCGIGGKFDNTKFEDVLGVAVGHNGLVYLCQTRDGVSRAEAF